MEFEPCLYVGSMTEFHGEGFVTGPHDVFGNGRVVVYQFSDKIRYRFSLPLTFLLL